MDLTPYAAFMRINLARAAAGMPAIYEMPAAATEEPFSLEDIDHMSSFFLARISDDEPDVVGLFWLVAEASKEFTAYVAENYTRFAWILSDIYDDQSLPSHGAPRTVTLTLEGGLDDFDGLAANILPVFPGGLNLNWTTKRRGWIYVRFARANADTGAYETINWFWQQIDIDALPPLP